MVWSFSKKVMQHEEKEALQISQENTKAQYTQTFWEKKLQKKGHKKTKNFLT